MDKKEEKNISAWIAYSNMIRLSRCCFFYCSCFPILLITWHYFSMGVYIIQTKGELSAEKKEKYEEAYNNYQKLLSNTATFAVSSNFRLMDTLQMGVTLTINLAHFLKVSLAGLGGSVGCAVRLETRRSRVQPPPRSATFFRGD